MLALGEDTVRDHIKTIGLYRNKAKNVIKLSQLLVDEFDSEVPQTREELVRLPGVGRKTANVVLNEVFGQPTIAVDTHIFRGIIGFCCMADMFAKPERQNAMRARYRTFAGFRTKHPHHRLNSALLFMFFPLNESAVSKLEK